MKITRHEYFVYITTNPNRTALYVGVTSDIGRRLVKHYANRGFPDTHAGKYYCDCLVYLEMYQYIEDAINREKEIKKWGRAQKLDLIAGFNPKWKFLNQEWCEEWPPQFVWREYYEGLRAEKKDKNKGAAKG